MLAWIMHLGRLIRGVDGGDRTLPLLRASLVLNAGVLAGWCPATRCNLPEQCFSIMMFDDADNHSRLYIYPRLVNCSGARSQQEEPAN